MLSWDTSNFTISVVITFNTKLMCNCMLEPCDCIQRTSSVTVTFTLLQIASQNCSNAPPLNVWGSMSKASVCVSEKLQFIQGNYEKCLVWPFLSLKYYNCVTIKLLWNIGVWTPSYILLVHVDNNNPHSVYRFCHVWLLYSFH